MLIETNGTVGTVAHLRNGPFMPVAGDRHHVRPVGRRHDHSSNLGAGHVEGGGALVLRALDAGAAVLVGRLVVAENALLRGEQTNRRGVGMRKLCVLSSRFRLLAFEIVNLNANGA